MACIALQKHEQGYGILGIASEGDVFTHGAREADGTALTWGEMGYVVSLEDVSMWARGPAERHPAPARNRLAGACSSPTMLVEPGRLNEAVRQRKQAAHACV